MRDYHQGHKRRLSWSTANSYAESVLKWSTANNIDPDWMTGLYTVESHWDTTATDGLDSWGIPQLQVNTAQLVANEIGLNLQITAPLLTGDPDLAIRLSCRHFRDLLDQFKGDYIGATRAYNHGSVEILNTRLPGLDYFNSVFKQYWKFENFKFGKNDDEKMF